MISFDEAVEIVCREARPLGAEPVALSNAHRRILAEPVTAAVASPPATVSAMDGYAMRDAELAGGRRSFLVAGESFPGAPFGGEAPAGACIRIFTGAPLPAGMDRVVIQENVRREEQEAIVEAISASSHIRRRGSDFEVGDRLLAAGRMLDARALVAAAGADLAEVTAWRRPRIALLGTGDELAAAGTARDSGGRLIPESLSPGLAALADDWGGQVTASRRVADDLAALEEAAGEAVAAADLVVLTGGASVGEKDFAKPAFAGLGLDLLFAKVAIKPGKPVWFGRAKGTLVMGLPGNPTSAMVTARLLLAPLIAGLSGRDPASALRWSEAMLAGELEAVGDRETFVRGRWNAGKVEPMPNQDSGSQRTLADCDLLIRRPAGLGPSASGDGVAILPF